MTWAKGTDGGDKLRREIKSFIKTWLAVEAYKSQLPRVQWEVFLPGEAQKSLVRVVIFTGPDSENKPHVYAEPGSGKQVNEEFFRVAVVVRTDKKGGGAPNVSAFYGALNSLFSAAMKEGTPECTARIAAGIYNLRVVPEGMEVNPGDEAEEGTFYRQDIYLKCSTDTYLT